LNRQQEVFSPLTQEYVPSSDFDGGMQADNKNEILASLPANGFNGGFADFAGQPRGER
jgi:hypothetical protein